MSRGAIATPKTGVGEKPGRRGNEPEKKRASSLFLSGRGLKGLSGVGLSPDGEDFTTRGTERKDNNRFDEERGERNSAYMPAPRVTKSHFRKIRESRGIFL